MIKRYSVRVEGFDYGSYDELYKAIQVAGSSRAYFDIWDNTTDAKAVIDWEEYQDGWGEARRGYVEKLSA